MELAGADVILVSGYGVRQGVILDQLDLAACPGPRQVRDASVTAVLARLRGGTAGLAAPPPAPRRPLRRRWRRSSTPSLLDMAAHAARLVDAGARLDHYGRWSETANLVTTADLDGFTHAELVDHRSPPAQRGRGRDPVALRRESRVARGRPGARPGTAGAGRRHRSAASPPRTVRRWGGWGVTAGSMSAGMPPMLLPGALAERCRRVLHRDVRELSDVRLILALATTRPEVAVEFK